MEQAVNMFTGGMVLDSHPLVQSSDTLSDALNATYITMNGNEVVLQNDMGNRRVDNAYLPAGYEPVGIKEHGGIIYIAAYNPITHRSQIGSFPSPERNMGTEYEDNGTEFNFSNFVSSGNYLTVNGIKFLKDDILLFPLTKDTSLHAGDKFTVYSDYIWNYSHLITNFGTEDGNGVHKYTNNPFNSYFTLSLGIMNSQNEFSDITSTLERFDSAGNIIKNLESDNDKFNTGYFIAPNNWEQINNGLTGDSAALLENRGKIGANTYAYKLTGPLYLKAELNHIQTFSYSINMSKIMTSQNQFTINLYITGTAIYNCPDSGEADESAYFDSFKLLRKEFHDPYGNYTITVPGSIILKEPRVYDSTTGLYTSSITKQFSFQGLYLDDFNPNITDNYFLNYLIAVPIFHPTVNNVIESGLDEQIYLSNLSESGSIDISKIGTNDCELGMWRYKNVIKDGEITSTLLDYRFDCYTDLVTVFRDLTITLHNQTTVTQGDIELNSLITVPDEVTSGRQSIAIDWTTVDQESRINFQDLYLAEIKYTKYNESTGASEDVVIYRFILGTTLFNSCYEESSNDYTPDFGIFMGEVKDGYYQINQSGWKKITPVTVEGTRLRTIYLSVDLDLVTNPSITIKTHPTIQSTSQGKPIYTVNALNKYNDVWKTDPKQVKINCPTSWTFTNRGNYPKNTFLQNLGTSLTLNSSNITKEFQAEEIFSYDQAQNIESFKEDIATISDINTQNNECTFSLILKDKIKTSFEQQTRTVGKAYFELSSQDEQYETMIHNIMSRNQVYCNLRLQVNQNWDAGYADYCNSLNPYGPPNGGQGHNFWGVQDWGATVWFSWFNNVDYFSNWNISPGDEWGYWKDMFKNMKCPFTFGYTVDSDDYHFKNTRYTEGSRIEAYPWDNLFEWPKGNSINTGFYDSVYYTRVWWADEDGNPCLLNNFDEVIDHTSNYLHPGLFSAGTPSTGDTERARAVYDGILSFLGNMEDTEKNISYQLVVPIENMPYEGFYPTTSSYIYFEDQKVNLTVDVQYNLVTGANSGVSNSGCLQFQLPTNFSKTKNISTTVKMDNSFSQSIIQMMQNNNLSSFSIDLDYGTVLSENDPLKHLYVRSSRDTYKLKEVPSDYPLQINEGVKNAFPIVCKKQYKSNQNQIGNPFSVSPFWGEWGTSENWIAEGDLGFKVCSMLDVHSQSIPVLFQKDLINPIKNMFNY